MKAWPIVQPNIIAVNKEAWNKVPRDLQQTIRDVMTKWQTNYWIGINDPANWTGVFKYAISHGMTVYDPPSDVRATFASIRENAKEQVVSDSGKQGKQALDRIMAALAKAGYSAK